MKLSTMMTMTRTKRKKEEEEEKEEEEKQAQKARKKLQENVKNPQVQKKIPFFFLRNFHFSNALGDGDEDEDGDIADGGPDTPSPDVPWNSQNMTQYDSDHEEAILESEENRRNFDDEDGDGEVIRSGKPVCKYGTDCYRTKNKDHLGT